MAVLVIGDPNLLAGIVVATDIAASLAGAASAIERERFDLAVLDLDGAGPPDVALATRDPDLMWLVVGPRGARASLDAVFGPERTGDWDFVATPIDRDGFAHKVRHALATASRRRRELAELRGANDRLRIEMIERLRLEAERRLASKLEGIGQLASGIAHEINTPTQYILSNAEMLDDALRELLPVVDPALGEDLAAAVLSILSGAKSIARIVGAMREFSRSDPPEMRPADLNRAVNATLEVVRHEYRQLADIELSLEELPQVHCHVGEIQQVIANLIVNAAHAIERRDPKISGLITIASMHDRTRGRVQISVADNGIGIPAENRERVFDPFFTTKPVGRGTGQGLAIAHNVVTRHAGTLTFESALGIGTRFVVSLPIRGPSSPP